MTSASLRLRPGKNSFTWTCKDLTNFDHESRINKIASHDSWEQKSPNHASSKRCRAPSGLVYFREILSTNAQSDSPWHYWMKSNMQTKFSSLPLPFFVHFHICIYSAISFSRAWKKKKIFSGSKCDWKTSMDSLKWHNLKRRCWF